MKYIVCAEPGHFELKDKPEVERGENEAILQVKKVGICGTDLHAYAGNQAFFTYPRILGHELATEVLEIDDNPLGINAGDKVVIMPYVSCGKCYACKSGKTNCCSGLQVLGIHTDGGMQERISVPVNLLLPAQDLSYDEMAIVEPLAIGAHAVRRADVRENEYVAVIGCGPIGLGIMKLAQERGAKVIALDINEQRLQHSKNAFGVDYIVNVANKPIEAIAEITGGNMAAVVFDASGNKRALESGPDYMAHGGRFVLVGLSKGELTYQHPAIHAKETTLMCSRNATLKDFQHVMEVLSKKHFPIQPFITHNVKYTEMIENFDHWLDPDSGVIKATVDFEL